MDVLTILVIALIILIPIGFILKKNEVSGTKLMLLGIHITLIGGIVAVDPNSDLIGFEYLIIIVGFIFSIFGLANIDN